MTMEFIFKDFECKPLDEGCESVKVDAKLKIEKIDDKHPELKPKEPFESIEGFNLKLIIHDRVFLEGTMLVLVNNKKKKKVIGIVMQPPKEFREPKKFQELMKKYGFKLFKKFDQTPIGLGLKEVPEDEEILTENFLRKTLEEVEFFTPSEDNPFFDICIRFVVRKAILILIQKNLETTGRSVLLFK